MAVVAGHRELASDDATERTRRKAAEMPVGSCGEGKSSDMNRLGSSRKQKEKQNGAVKEEKLKARRLEQKNKAQPAARKPPQHAS